MLCPGHHIRPGPAQDHGGLGKLLRRGGTAARIEVDTVWGGDLPEDTRTLDTHIKQIRRAITPHNDRIVTLRGVGYRFEKK